MISGYPRKSVSLSRLLGRISELFEEQITPHEVWVRAEISSYKPHSSGHLYFDLVEHNGSAQLARCRAVIWRGQVEQIELRSGMHLREHLKDGREILCLARATYHPVYGLSLHISDVDPDFALGEIEKRRRETIARLEKENLIRLNRLLILPKVIQRIAVIAAGGSAGLADLIQQLKGNSYGYGFRIEHFQASVQGDEAAGTLIAAFERIDTERYDAIVLIRGGGAALDLDVFNDYLLNKQLSQAPIPFIVGIGHETDRTVVDEWAAVSLKTPSAVGAWLVERCRDFEVEVSTVYQGILEFYRHRTDRERALLNDRVQQLSGKSRQRTGDELLHLHGLSRGINTVAQRFVSLRKERQRLLTDHIAGETRRLIREHRYDLEEHAAKADRYGAEVLVRARHSLNMNSELLEVYQPASTLRRGYHILRKEGEIVMDLTRLKPEETIEIEAFAARLEAVIKSIKRKDGKG